MKKIFAELDENDTSIIRLHDVDYMLKDLCNTVPGLKYDRKSLNGTWSISTGWANCLALRGTFKDNLDIGPRLNQWVLDERATRIEPAMALRQALDAPGADSLYPFQRAGVAFLKTAKRALLADAPGTGKTRQSMSAILELYKEGIDPFPLLVICPNSTKVQWAREIEVVWPGLDVQVVSGTTTQRRKQLERPAHVYIINWEALRGHSNLVPYGNVAFVKCIACGGDNEKVSESKCQVHEKELNRIPFKSVIADEAHRMKSGKSQVTRAAKAATGDAEIRFALTGTPISNTIEDLWSILNWISPKEWPVKSKFIDRTVESTFDMYGNKQYWGVKSHMKEEFEKTFHPIMRRMSKEVVLPFLPPVVRERRDVDMAPKQKKAYIQMRDQMLADLDDGGVHAVTSPMTVSQRLTQFASSYGTMSVEDYVDKDSGELKTKTSITLDAPSNKIDAFMDDIEDFGDDQVVVFSASKQLINLLSAKMDKHGYKHGLITGDIVDDFERQEYIDRFQEGKLQFILVTTAAGGTGLTLTAANTAVFLSRPWSMIESEQAEGRVLRIGSEIHDSVTYVDYVSTGTVDEHVMDVLDGKLGRLEDILQDKDLLRKYIAGEL